MPARKELAPESLGTSGDYGTASSMSPTREYPRYRCKACDRGGGGGRSLQDPSCPHLLPLNHSQLPRNPAFTVLRVLPRGGRQSLRPKIPVHKRDKGIRFTSAQAASIFAMLAARVRSGRDVTARLLAPDPESSPGWLALGCPVPIKAFGHLQTPNLWLPEHFSRPSSNQ